MENKQYQVLARKYRPQNFSQLVGQPALVQTLSNEIENNKIPHAFILTGIRGIGKTTTARLIAKSLNCSSSDHSIINACGQCEHCKAISNSTDADVIEFDAASHTGVDDVRQIIESTMYAPVNSRYKIFIMDEVHMLSNSAFNALLKTLEEPPEYIKFIFATTEIRKVPITIISRCQRFDLRRLDFDEIKQHIKNICSLEGFEIENEALDVIASSAEGSVRDSLSILDRVLSYNNYNKLITLKSVSEMLGFSNKKNIYNLFISLLKGQTEVALKQFDEIYSTVIDINSLMQDLLSINHNMILAKTINNFFDISHLPNDQIEIIKQTINSVDISSLIRIWKMLLNSEKELKSDFDPKKIMDIILINICFGSGLPSLEEVLKKAELKDLPKDIAEKTKQESNNKNTLAQLAINNFEGAKILDN